MPGGEAHVFQVVVLAAGPDALLGTGGPGVGPGVFSQEHLFKLHHPGIGEQQGGVPGGHQGGTGHPGVAVGREEAQKGLPDLAAGHLLLL